MSGSCIAFNVSVIFIILKRKQTNKDTFTINEQQQQCKIVAELFSISGKASLVLLSTASHFSVGLL